MSSAAPNRRKFSYLLSGESKGVPPHCDIPKVKSVPDDELIQRLRVGEAAGFAVFFDQYARCLFAMTWCILRDWRAAEDALENAFTWIWNHPFAFESKRRRSLYSWALLAARSAALDLLSRRSKENRPTQWSDDELPLSEVEAGLWEGKTVIQPGERVRVNAALNLLSQPQRKTLELAFFAAMTDEEISGAFGAPLGDVKGRIRDGLVILRGHLPRVTTPIAGASLSPGMVQ